MLLPYLHPENSDDGGGEERARCPRSGGDRAKRVILALCALLLGAGGIGCTGPLKQEGLPRTQYERYSRLHGNYTPATRGKALGWGDPLLRQRLAAEP